MALKQLFFVKKSKNWPATGLRTQKSFCGTLELHQFAQHTA